MQGHFFIDGIHVLGVEVLIPHHPELGIVTGVEAKTSPEEKKWSQEAKKLAKIEGTQSLVTKLNKWSVDHKSQTITKELLSSALYNAHILSELDEALTKRGRRLTNADPPNQFYYIAFGNKSDLLGRFRFRLLRSFQGWTP